VTDSLNLSVGGAGMKTMKELFFITLGCVVMSFGINQMVVPAHLIAGGLTGICVIVYHFLQIPVGTLFFVLNVPLLVVGHILIGKKFSIYTIYSVVITSLLLDVIPVQRIWTHDALLSSLFGGALIGSGSAVMLRFGGSSGGLDIVARIAAKYRNISMGKFSLIVNGAIVLASGFMFDAQTALFTLISIYVAAKAWETILTHVNKASVVIVTDRGDRITQSITDTMQRGVTMWKASGGFTKEDKQVLMCVLVNAQIVQLTSIVRVHDPEAFMTVLPTHDTIGQFVQAW
jgi:uncharacterized membrane-anchored protein YitT (DUF2179 family)